MKNWLSNGKHWQEREIVRIRLKDVTLVHVVCDCADDIISYKLQSGGTQEQDCNTAVSDVFDTAQVGMPL